MDRVSAASNQEKRSHQGLHTWLWWRNKVVFKPILAEMSCDPSQAADEFERSVQLPNLIQSFLVLHSIADLEMYVLISRMTQRRLKGNHPNA